MGGVKFVKRKNRYTTNGGKRQESRDDMANRCSEGFELLKRAGTVDAEMEGTRRSKDCRKMGAVGHEHGKERHGEKNDCMQGGSEVGR